MARERSASEVAAVVATEAAVLEAAARELRVPLDELTATKLAGDASSRSFIRLVHPTGAVVAVLYPWPFSVDEGSMMRLERWTRDQPETGRLTFANDPLCHLELTSLLARFDVPVPEVVAVADRDGVIFVEDAGDDLLQAWTRSAAPDQAERAYEHAVDLIARIRSATSEALDSGCVAGHLALDGDKLGWELEFWRRNTFDSWFESPLDPDLDSAVRSECRALADELGGCRRVLCHRDYHARNLIVGTDGARSLVVIDFQDARLGPLTYDVVSLLEDPYAELSTDRKERLRERFAAAASVEPGWEGADAFREQYDLMTIQRLLKAIGTFTNQAAERGRSDYLPYVAPASREARAAIDRIGRYPALGRALDAIAALSL